MHVHVSRFFERCPCGHMVSIAIQAGGRSRRMGVDKALVSLGGKTLIEHILLQVQGLSEDVFITTNHPERFEWLHTRLVRDKLPGSGALAGLYTALHAALGETVLVLACDLPFVNRAVLQGLLDLSPGVDAVVPRVEGRYEPLHAVYRRATCLPAVEAAIAAGGKRLISFYPEICVKSLEGEALERLDPDGRSFFNINTLADLERAHRMLEDGS